MNSDLADLITNPLLSIVKRIAAYFPGFVAAFLLLLLGVFIARALRTMAESLLNRIRLDHYTSKVGINEILVRLGMGKSPSAVISFLIYWFILFIFMISAANAVNMMILFDLFQRFAAFFPALVAAIVILFACLLFGRFLSEIVANS